mmetsp:Transcript_24768/g.98309  ORF Transcript_24768/g.98309 Transcript_24768/m.98309 type:complete len:203 (+) Transcript_24768:1866-2474(+)
MSRRTAQRRSHTSRRKPLKRSRANNSAHEHESQCPSGQSGQVPEHIASTFVIAAEDARALGKNMAQRLFGIFDSTARSENLGPRGHRIERGFGLGSIGCSCEFDRIRGDPQRFVDAAHPGECQTHHFLIHRAARRVCTEVHYRTDARQSLEPVTRSTNGNECARPRDLCRQDDPVAQWIVVSHAAPCFYVQPLGHVELLQAQ